MQATSSTPSERGGDDGRRPGAGWSSSLRTLARRLGDPRAVLAIAATVGFVLLAAVAGGAGAVGFDAPVTEAVTRLPVPTAAWRTVTDAGGGMLLLPIGVLFVLGLLLGRRPGLALLVAVVLIAMAFGTDQVKEIVARPRPPDVSPALARGFSFPSAHALQSVVVYGLIALVVWRSRLPPLPRLAAVAAAAVLAVLVGLSRIALGVHYPSDVVAGWMAGTAILAGVVFVTRASDARRSGDS